MLKSMQNLSEAAPVLSNALRQIDQGGQLARLEEAHKENVKAILAVQRALDESQGHTVAMLRKWAREINGWADESQQYGWSVHQVERNRKLAGEIHRQADLVEAERELLLVGPCV